MRPSNGWLMLLACLIALPASAATPSQVQAEYRLELEGLEVAEIKEAYTRTDDRYHIESVSRAVGIAAMLKPETILGHSEGTVTARGLHPLKVTQQRSKDVERNASAVFDWQTHQLVLTDRLGTRQLALPDDTQDRFSAMYQFMFLDLPGAGTLTFHMTNGSKLDIYDYQVTPEQSVDVPGGQFKALYVATPPQANGARTELWLAVEHHLIPVKVVVTEGDGNRYTQSLTRLTITP
ncbi:DUF3108 domain-containing protein [Ferriphaselus sp. R-1]|uniref:DUF3108 domain-containing protein n=1 Tax=Ferriphaselus sp. R-1 TaxID=1485544 RepID=UPI0005578CDE|nr:DUF3108 domain-containing protein [Ferriphaselus sp. R-1]